VALIIFDIDGTLLETQRVTVPAVQRTFARYGLAVPDEEVICSFFGKSVQEYETWLGAQCPARQVAEIVAATNALELEMIGAEGRLYPGVREALTALHNEGHVLALCSNGPDDYVAEFVRAYGLGAMLCAVKARGDRYSGKAVMVAEILEEVAARPVVLVGDRHDDIEAAHAHGAKAVAAGYGFGGAEEHGDADAVAKRPEELLSTIHAVL
jgi:phosphoglycolate phosphatase-like HAD superfamily hydrolase